MAVRLPAKEAYYRQAVKNVAFALTGQREDDNLGLF